MILKAVRNVSNRPLSFVFDDGTVNVLPGQISEHYPESKWDGSLADKQLHKYVKDREAKILTKEEPVKKGEDKKGGE